MIITFENQSWPKPRISVIVDNEKKVCTMTETSVDYLKNQKLKDVIAWGLQRAALIHIKHTSPTPVPEPNKLDACCSSVEACTEAGKCLKDK